MPQPRFAQILSSRRKQLRLSIPQAAKVLRMRESVLEAFEDGDFDRLPALGYAQGMVASYARYLGLDSRQITELYETEHEQYVAQVTGRETTGLARLSDEPANRGPASAASAARPSRQYGQAALPAARGTGGVNLPSDYGRASTYGQGFDHRGYQSQGSAEITPYSPQGRAGSPAYNSPYDERSTSRTYGEDGQIPSSRDVRSGSQASRRYTTRIPDAADERTRRRQAATARRYRSYEGERRGDYGAAERTGDITLRSVRTGQYRDDMRYDDGVDPYRPSSTRAGRAAVSRASQPPERPNVRRRQNPGRGQDPRSRGRNSSARRGGVIGAFESFAAEPARVMLLVILLLALILGLIIVFSVRSCASASTEPRQVNVVTASTASSSSNAQTLSESEQQTIADAAAKAAASSAAAATQETVVTVSVASGSTTWVEVTCDGEVKRAESITGAWSEQYTVTKSVEIQVADSSVVTVEKNGERVQLSSKTTGLASVTIQGTDPSAATADASTADATTSDASGSGEGDGTDYSSDSYDSSYDDSYDSYDSSYDSYSYDESY